MYQISEEKFYNICDSIENVDKSTFPYEHIPSIKELTLLKMEDHIAEHLPYLIYLSEDPFRTKDSAELAQYVKALLRDNLELV